MGVESTLQVIVEDNFAMRTENRNFIFLVFCLLNLEHPTPMGFPNWSCHASVIDWSLFRLFMIGEEHNSASIKLKTLLSYTKHFYNNTRCFLDHVKALQIHNRKQDIVNGVLLVFLSQSWVLCEFLKQI